MKRIFIATTTFCQNSKGPLELLKSNGFYVESNNEGRKLYQSELVNIISTYDGIIAGTESYNEEILNHAINLKVISRLGVGIDNIDVNVANKLGINIIVTKTTPAIAVAELSLGLILNLARKISTHNYNLKSGVWKKNMGSLISEKTLGIIGFGKIGKSLFHLTKGFDLKYLIYDINIDSDYLKYDKVEYCTLDNLLVNSDIVSIHANLTADNHKLIDYNALKMMKPTSIIINTSRGEIINENDLVRALKKNLIGGAGIDVFESEPYNGRLIESDKVIMTPHIAAYAQEIRAKMELEAATNLVKEFNKL